MLWHTRSMPHAHNSLRGPRPRTALLAALLTLAVAVLLAPAVAGATTIDYAGGVVKVTGTEGSDDVAFSNGYGDFEDDLTKLRVYGGDGSSLTPAAAAVCTDMNSDENIWELNVWHCPRPTKVVVSLLGDNDYLSAYENGDLTFTIPLEVDGGAGDDQLDGGSGNDIFRGGSGNDLLTGRDGDDRIYGQDGNDTLNGDFGSSGPGGNDLLDGGAGNDEFEQYVGFGYPAGLKGNDTYIGGPGNDSFSYFHRSDPVKISLDGLANDGMAGESDNIHPDIEAVGGSSGDDVIVGSPGAETLWGGDGDDKISGGSGDDKLYGDGGDDLIDGGPGDDELDGGCMSDMLIGGPGSDSFNSDGSCQSDLRSPFDHIDARDGERDKLIFCQWDTDQAGDTAVVDPVDPVTKSGPGACKNVQVGTVGGGSGTGKAPKGKVRLKLGPQLRLIVGNGRKGSAGPQRIELKRQRLLLGTLFATKRVAVTVNVSVSSGRKSVSLPRRRLAIAAGGSKPVNFALSRRSLAVVKGSKKVAVKVSFKVGKKSYRKRFQVPVTKGDGGPSGSDAERVDGAVGEQIWGPLRQT